MIDGIAVVLCLREQLLEPETRSDTNNHTYAAGNAYKDPEAKYARIRLLDNGNNGNRNQNFGMSSPVEMECNNVQSSYKEFNLPSNVMDDIHSIREALDQMKEKRVKAETKEKCLREWKVICCVTDRLFFIMYLFINVVGIIVIFCGQVV